jgi:hypothetical protein
MARVVRPGGTVAAYVWDYADGMQMMRHFWDAAGALDPSARELDEGRRFPLCKPEPLTNLFYTSGLEKIEVRAIYVPTVFHDFDDYWSPFLRGQVPAPGYAMSLDQERRAALRVPGPYEAFARDVHLFDEVLYPCRFNVLEPSARSSQKSPSRHSGE